jgi:hypothetical protein
VDDFLEGRRQQENYFEFYKRYVREVVGRTEFKDKVTNYNGSDELATVSDEALAFLLLENIEERTLDICTKTGGELASVAHGI